MHYTTRFIFATMVLLALSTSAQCQLPREVASVDQGLIRVDREGLPSIFVGGSDEGLARNDMVGVWKCVRFERHGKSRPNVAAGLTFTFTRGRLEIEQPGFATAVMSFGIDVSRYPRGFHWVLPGSFDKQKGVYWIEGDRMWICVGAVNHWGSNKFVTQPGDGRSFFVLERVKRNVDDTLNVEPEWEPLGSYLLSPKGADGGKLVKLTVNHAGTVTGEAFDLDTKKKQPVEGVVSAETQALRLWIGEQRSFQVSVNLQRLSQDRIASAQVQQQEDVPAETWVASSVFPPE